jgi:hypothetical protein
MEYTAPRALTLSILDLLPFPSSELVCYAAYARGFHGHCGVLFARLMIAHDIPVSFICILQDM